MKLVILTIALFIFQGAKAQDSGLIIIEAGQKILDVVTPEKLFRFANFKQGKVLLKDDKIHQAVLNLNYINGEIEFISANDTLAIIKDIMLNIKRVEIADNSFFYNKDKGYLEVVAENKNATLLKRKRLLIVSRDKIGAYNLTSPASSITTFNTIMDGQGTMRNLTVRENITMRYRTEYFFADKYNTVLLANRKNIEKLFFKKKDEIENYFKEHVVDFNKESDLMALFTFLNQM